MTFDDDNVPDAIPRDAKDARRLYRVVGVIEALVKRLFPKTANEASILQTELGIPSTDWVITGGGYAVAVMTTRDSTKIGIWKRNERARRWDYCWQFFCTEDHEIPNLSHLVEAELRRKDQPQEVDAFVLRPWNPHDQG